tara:strand:+ start:3317 stop:8746 length:5430 start_codon:yes stop_codon:yes gene_type:complete
MGEVQNTFVKSKMNKDLDDRLIPKGEYRNAENINVSRSEGADVGALENILGNIEIANFTTQENVIPDGCVIVGSLIDESLERIYVLITNYTDTSADKLSNVAPEGSYCSICIYNVLDATIDVLVKGSFLNLSTTHEILGINLIEDLLFWTDNRNQPRRININSALNANAYSTTPYYSTEENIALARYYPYSTPSLYRKLEFTQMLGSFNDNTSGYTYNATLYVQGGQDTSLLKQGMKLKLSGLRGKGTNDQPYSKQTSNITVGRIRSSPTNTADIHSTDPLNLTWDAQPVTAYYPLSVSKSSEYYAGSVAIANVDNYCYNGSTLFPGEGVNIQNSFFVSMNQRLVEGMLVVSNKMDANNQEGMVFYPNTRIKKMRYVAPMSSGAANNQNYTPGTSFNATQTTTNKTVPPHGHLITLTKNMVGFTAKDPSGYFIRDDSGLIAPRALSVGDQLSFREPNLPQYDIVTGAITPGGLAGGYDKNWPGDKNYLKDKFVRFAYRFKFNDGEFSLISPWTQPAFIPKQHGYMTTGQKIELVREFIAGTGTPGQKGSGFVQVTGMKKPKTFITRTTSQEQDLVDSTVVEFFQNFVDEVTIDIETPYPVNELNEKLKVDEIQILYKESNGLNVKVLDKVPFTDLEIINNTTYVYSYNYQSRKPFRNLPESDVTRVYDKIPARAKTQSVTGNRIVLGNFFDKPTPPLTLDFAIGVTPKLQPFEASSSFSSVAYPNHTVKQNRTYQVGVVLQDKYGRSSDVILSQLGKKLLEYPAGSGQFFSGSTYFHEYHKGKITPYPTVDLNPISTYLPANSATGATGILPTEESMTNWFGDSIKVLFSSAIPDSVSYASGYPGLYRDDVINVIVDSQASGTPQVFLETFNKYISVGSIVTGKDSNSLAFEESVIEVNNRALLKNEPNFPGTLKQITLSNVIELTSSTPLTITGNGNSLGWYSYKVVVKQTANNYHNAYLPPALAGFTTWSVPQSKHNSMLTLTGDNINKISPDLKSTAPLQVQFKSSDDIIFPIVSASRGGSDTAEFGDTLSQQILLKQSESSFRSTNFTIDGIGRLTDLGQSRAQRLGQGDNMEARFDRTTENDGKGIQGSGIANPQSNPICAKVSTYGNLFGNWYNSVIFKVNQLDPFMSKNVGIRSITTWQEVQGKNNETPANYAATGPTLQGTIPSGLIRPSWYIRGNGYSVGTITNGQSNYKQWGPATGVAALSKTGSGSGLVLQAIGNYISYTSDTACGAPADCFSSLGFGGLTWRIYATGEGYEEGDILIIPPYWAALPAPQKMSNYNISNTNGLPEDAPDEVFNYGPSWSVPLKIVVNKGLLSMINTEQPLTIVEVKPTESNLDIYWETSTSGLIQDLNREIEAAAGSGTPNELNFNSENTSNLDFYYPENAVPLNSGDWDTGFGGLPTVISEFTVMNSALKILPNVTVTMTVANGQGTNVTSEFDISKIVSAMGNTFMIKPKVQRYFRANSQLNTFDFTFTCVNIDLGIVYTSEILLTGSVSNIIPLSPGLLGSTIGIDPGQYPPTYNIPSVIRSRTGSIVGSNSPGIDQVFFRLLAQNGGGIDDFLNVTSSINGSTGSGSGGELKWEKVEETYNGVVLGSAEAVGVMAGTNFSFTAQGGSLDPGAVGASDTGTQITSTYDFGNIVISEANNMLTVYFNPTGGTASVSNPLPNGIYGAEYKVTDANGNGLTLNGGDGVPTAVTQFSTPTGGVTPGTYLLSNSPKPNSNRTTGGSGLEVQLDSSGVIVNIISYGDDYTNGDLVFAPGTTAGQKSEYIITAGAGRFMLTYTLNPGSGNFANTANPYAPAI